MIIAAIYLISYVLSYIIFKKAWQLKFDEWTVENRTFMLCLSLGGPFSLVAALIVYAMEVSDDDSPASW